MYNEISQAPYGEHDTISQIVAASPKQLMLTLFNHLTDELIKAKGHITHKRYIHKANSINKCIDILNVMTSSLNFDGDNELATILSKIYDYCVYRLYDASAKLSVDLITEVETVLQPLHLAWQDITEE
ncbi:flagellar export chaperone FliS [Yersinia enterocolitica]|uniref:flagellar export chaperone FliS n=1 Tax=Yersinia TaxID=629 RepID=UPI0005E4E49E|nr:flagellar export chaperone FliS [Yersinia enterocolitica]EKN3735713.1 flagellar export chaperone FliS [Yersinia enterocolitica]EKN3945844.1 flagellar export chaperone FliS [Yersinia enterocolitica]EKN3981754.1 flagellar export chaperone FliS [Yersinia enterocolitica]EKN3987105.1 flagellar export chaperone FliS [Yersinia enterocolitica]EKN4709197.1 flagellar export chaperone FliS [Yersinia enterocolitica]